MKKFLIAVSLIILVTGCASNDDTNKTEQKQKESTEQSQEIEQNKELTKKVKDEEGVLDGQVYEQDGMAIGTLVLDKKVSDKDAKKLAEKYAEELKKVYIDLSVNVQAVRDGENIANISLN